MKFCVALVLYCVLLPFNAKAEQGITAADVGRWCGTIGQIESGVTFETGYCLGFMRGILSGIHLPALDKCVPRDISPYDAAKIYQEYLKRHQNRAALGYVDLMSDALRTTYLCGAK